MSTIHTKPRITVTLEATEFRLITQSLTGTIHETDETNAEALGARLLDQLIKEEERRIASLKKARDRLNPEEEDTEIPVTILRPGSTGIDDFGAYGGPTPTKLWADSELNRDGVSPGRV